MTQLQDFLNSPIPNVTRMGRQAKQGDLFGLELECEGVRVDWNGTPDIVKDWAPHADGSLRNHHGSSCEWVFNGPVGFDRCVDRVDKLFAYFKDVDAKLVCSNRTSFHVHFNMADKNAYQLVNLFILFTVLEDVLDSYCGEHRRGNLFCLSSRHAEEQVRWMTDACFDKFNFGAFREEWRYCSLNLASLNKFGTVEFRAMRGLDNRTDVLAWLSILKELCDYACYTMKNPARLMEQISVLTPDGFLREVFSRGNYQLLTKDLPDGFVNQSLYEGLRLVQMLAYRIGNEFDKVRVKGRDFWASFGKAADKDVELDVNPDVLVAQGGVQPARGRAPRAIPGAFARAVAAEEERRRAALRDEHEELEEGPQPAPPQPAVMDMEAVNIPMVQYMWDQANQRHVRIR